MISAILAHPGCPHLATTTKRRAAPPAAHAPMPPKKAHGWTPNRQSYGGSTSNRAGGWPVGHVPGKSKKKKVSSAPVTAAGSSAPLATAAAPPPVLAASQAAGGPDAVARGRKRGGSAPASSRSAAAPPAKKSRSKQRKHGGGSHAAKKGPDGQARKDVGSKATAARVANTAPVIRSVHGLGPNSPLSQPAITAMVRQKLLPPHCSWGAGGGRGAHRSIAGVAAYDQHARPTNAGKRAGKRASSAQVSKEAQGSGPSKKGKEVRAPRGSGGSNDSAHVQLDHRAANDKLKNPRPSFFLGQCDHDACDTGQCCHGVRANADECVELYAKMQDCVCAGLPTVCVRECTDGASMGEGKIWSAETETLAVMNMANSVSVSGTILQSLSEVPETMTSMGALLDRTAEDMARLKTVKCQKCGPKPVANFQCMDLKAEGVADRLSPGWYFCKFCTRHEQDRHLWPDAIAEMRAGPKKTEAVKKLGKLRTLEYAAEAATAVDQFAQTAEIVESIRSHCSTRAAEASGGEPGKAPRRFDSATLIAALDARGLPTTGKKPELEKRLCIVMRAEGPRGQAGDAAANAVADSKVKLPHWHKRDAWVKKIDEHGDDKVHDQIVNFANGSGDIKAILRMHNADGSDKPDFECFGHLGRPSDPNMPWHHRGAGVFHTSLHHRSVHFNLFAAIAKAHGQAHVIRLCNVLVSMGVTGIATEGMKKLSVIGRQPAPSDAFDGPSSIGYMYNLPTMIATVFTRQGSDPQEAKSAEQLLRGHRLMRDQHKLMLCLDFNAADSTTQVAGLGSDGPVQLRAASRKLSDWLLGVKGSNTHSSLAPKHEGAALYNSSFHNLSHICDMADLLWDEYKISIGKFSEQGSEAINKLLKKEFNGHCNNHRFPRLADNMFAVAAQNIWRQMFQYPDTRMRACMRCQLCSTCDADNPCPRFPQCSAVNSPVRLSHDKAGKLCPHHSSYTGHMKYEDISTALDKGPLF